MSHGSVSLLLVEYVSPFLPSPLSLVTLLRCSSTKAKAWRWKSTTAADRALQHEVGQKIHGFTISQVSMGPSGCAVCGTCNRAWEVLLQRWRSCLLCPQANSVLFHSWPSTEQSLQMKQFPDYYISRFPILPWSHWMSFQILESKPHSLMFLHLGTWLFTPSVTLDLLIS